MESTDTADNSKAAAKAPVLHKVGDLIRKLDRIETTGQTQPDPPNWD